MIKKHKKKIPHRFAKAIILYCIICATIFSLASLWIQYRTGSDTSQSLFAILGFFGGELLFIALRTIFKERQSNGD